MKVQTINNQQTPQKSFKMKFHVPEKVQKEVASRIETFAKLNQDNPINAEFSKYIVKKAKAFLACLYRDIIEHNAEPKNHRVYDDSITIKKIDFHTLRNDDSLLSKKKLTETDICAMNIAIDTSKDKHQNNYAIYNFQEPQQNFITNIQKKLIMGKNHEPLVDDDLKYLSKKLKEQASKDGIYSY